MSVRRRAKRRSTSGSSAPTIAQLLRSLKTRRYNSVSDYYESIARASEALGNVVNSVARLEAAHLASNRIPFVESSKTIVVHPTEDPEKDFRNIQSAIDYASPGDRILLKQGTFRSSGIIWVWKGIVIEGEKDTVIEGITHGRGRVLADPSINGGFAIVGRNCVRIKNLIFRHLHFAIWSDLFGSLLLEGNTFEDVYHSVHLSSEERSDLFARGNRVIISSLNQSSSRCRLNFYEEGHIFGFFCNGKIRSVLEGNHLEIKELTGSQQFHVVGVFCSGRHGSALIRNNFFKGWHAPISIYDVSHPSIFGNEIHGMCEDPEYKPIAIFVRNCTQPTICSNRITSRNLGSGSIGIATAETVKGSISDNRIDLGKDSNSGIFVYRCNGLLIGQNSIAKGPLCPIGLFGDQSEEVKNNLLFGNVVEGSADIRIAYASENTILGPRGERSSDPENALLGYGVEITHSSPLWLDREECLRHQRIFEHQGRKIWPPVPQRYLSGEQI